MNPQIIFLAGSCNPNLRRKPQQKAVLANHSSNCLTWQWIFFFQFSIAELLKRVSRICLKNINFPENPKNWENNISSIEIDKKWYRFLVQWFRILLRCCSWVIMGTWLLVYNSNTTIGWLHKLCSIIIAGASIKAVL